MRIIKIGKSPSNDIYREFQGDPTVSREHCEIFIDNDNNIFLTDLNSTNGTFVNVTVSSNKMEEAIKGSTAFFAPLQLMRPLTPLEEEPLIKNFSIKLL